MVKKDKKLPIVIGTVVIMIIIGIIISINTDKEPNYEKMSEEERSTAINQKIDKIDLTALSEMTERERIERYVGKFLEELKNENYDNAYDMLNEEFKSNFFNTIEKFEEYAKSRFPNRISIEYTNLERNGDIYVIWANISNPLRSKSESSEINFVVKENALDDFELSFNVNK